MSRTPKTPGSITGYDTDSEIYRIYFDSCTPPSETVVMAVAALTNHPQQELPSLWGSIDPDALDDLFQRSVGGVPADGHLTFHYVAHRVTVRATGLVTIEPSRHRP